MSKLYVAVGLPASGKSTYAQNLQNTVVISSDDIREEMFGSVEVQDNPELIFQTMYQRAKNWLKTSDVFLDATNISTKKRIAIIKDFRKHADEIVAVYFNTPYEICIYRNAMRNRTVPDHVIKRMYKTMQIPTYTEGWDKIDIYPKFAINEDKALHRVRLQSEISNPELTHDSLFDDTLGNLAAFTQIYDLPQDNPHHTFSVSRHTYYVWKDIVDNYDGPHKLAMTWTALFHDTGKAFCKEFSVDKRYASFIGHENVSAQLACDVLLWLEYDTEFVLQVVELVQNHMKLLSIGESEKGQKKLLDFVGQEVYNMLIRFRESDTSAK